MCTPVHCIFFIFLILCSSLYVVWSNIIIIVTSNKTHKGLTVQTFTVCCFQLWYSTMNSGSIVGPSWHRLKICALLKVCDWHFRALHHLGINFERGATRNPAKSTRLNAIRGESSKAELLNVLSVKNMFEWFDFALIFFLYSYFFSVL